ncbi:MAG TPA: hypothetical protein VF062_12720 [Candidatus Limnocylindrales bacterium]
MPPGKMVVLGLVTTRWARWSPRTTLKRRIDEVAKLRLIVETATDVWGGV